jgi:hypothetical protein
LSPVRLLSAKDLWPNAASDKGTDVSLWGTVHQFSPLSSISKCKEKSTIPPEDDLPQGSHGERKVSFPQWGWVLG